MKISGISALLIIVFSAVVFLFVPGPTNILGYSGEFFNKGQFWRIITFPFAHFSLGHLIENLIGMAITGFLAYEFLLKENMFIGYFLIINITIAAIAGIFMPSLLLAGISMGIYGLLGVLSLKGSNFVSKLIMIPLFASFALSDFLISKQIMSSSFHVAGFALGMALEASKIFERKKAKILTGDLNGKA